MENKAELLKILNYSTDYVQTTKLSDLMKEVTYKVIELRKIKTKYGPAIFAILRVGEDEVTNVFLPRRYVNLLNDEKVKFLNESDIKMQYIGGEYHQINFS